MRLLFVRRVLVISTDCRFRAVMRLLLTRRDCSVSATASIARVAELLAGESVDVVMIDDSQSPAAATVAAVEALRRPIGVVLVAEEARRAPSDDRVLAKWGPFGDIVAAVELADAHRERRPRAADDVFRMA